MAFLELFLFFPHNRYFFTPSFPLFPATISLLLFEPSLFNSRFLSPRFLFTSSRSIFIRVLSLYKPLSSIWEHHFLGTRLFRSIILKKSSFLAINRTDNCIWIPSSMRETRFRDNLLWRSVNYWINVQRGFFFKITFEKVS